MVGISREVGVVDRQVAGQVRQCLVRHAKGKPLDPADPAVDTLEACIAGDHRGRIAKATGATQGSFERLCTPPPTGKLDEAFPAFGITDAARANHVGLRLAPDLAHDVFGPDLDAALLAERDAAKCQLAVWKAADRCQQARTSAFRSCQQRALRGRGAPAAETYQALRATCLGNGPDAQPDPRGRVGASCSEPGKGIARALAKKCAEQDLAARFPGCAGETDTAGCLARHAACRSCLQVSDAGGLRRSCDLFDDGEPNGSCGEIAIDCQNPLDGSMFAAPPDGLLDFRGRVTGASQLEGVTVDGMPVALDAEGAFSHSITVGSGVQFVEVAATDETGAARTRVCSYLASETFAPEDGFLNDALSLTLAQASVDDGSREGAVSSFGDILHLALNSTGLRNTLHDELLAVNPLKPSSCDQEVLGQCVLRSEVRYVNSTVAGPNEAALTLVDDGFGVEATGRNVTVTLRVTGTASVIGDFDVTATVTAASLGAQLTADVFVQDGAFRAQARSGSVSSSVGTIGVQISGVPQFITNLVVGLAQNLIRSALETAIRDLLGASVDSYVDDLVATLDVPAQQVMVPRPGAPGSIALTFEADPSSASVTSARALFGLRARATAPAVHALPSLGVALPAGPLLGEPPLDAPLAFAGHVGVLNQLLHQLWRGGLLHGEIDATTVPEIPPGVVAGLEALLPPVVVGSGEGGLIARLGALRVTLIYPGLFDEAVLLSAGGEAVLTLAAENGVLRLADLGFGTVRISGVDATLAPGQQAIVALAATVLVQRLLHLTFEAAAPGLPVLAFALPESVGEFGLPVGSPLGLVDPIVESTPTHLMLSGALGVL